MTDTAKSWTIQASHLMLSIEMTYYQYYTVYKILNVFKLSDSELLNLTQLTVDGLVTIDNIEHGHDSGIMDMIADSWMA